MTERAVSDDGAGHEAGSLTVDRPGNAAGTALSVPDRVLYALFSRHADRRRHDADRAAYRGTDLRVSFEVYVARVYGLAWVVGLALFVAVAGVGVVVPDRTVAAVTDLVAAAVPLADAVPVPSVPRAVAAVAVALPAAALGRHGIRWLGGRYLRWVASSRRTDIERTLPGAVRYLRALSTGSDDHRTMLRKVARNRDAYGETAVAVRKALNTAALTGSLGTGLRRVARDTPSTETLAPFLLKFREHADQGPEELTSYLRMEGRMLSHRQRRAREQAQGFLELLAEMFIVLLVLPALLVIVLVVMSVLSPGLSAPVETPLGTTSVRGVVVYACAGFVLVVGACAAVVVDAVRPAGQSTPAYERPGSALGVVTTATTNPASASVAVAPLVVSAPAAAWALGARPENVVLVGYVAFALPVGLVAVRRARLDDAKDREIKDFVHAVSGHVSLGRPFSRAVELVARDVDLGPLDDDVADLAFNANLTTREGDLRTAALERFVDRVGTPLASQTMGLVTGALDAGSDAEDVFETLQTEVGRLHHEKQTLRNAMLVYVAVGWTTALLVVGIVVAVNGYVLDGFAQLSAVSGVEGSVGIQPNAVDPATERRRFYVVTQATMLAAGWFAGSASRGYYEALLHSGALVCVAYLVFAGVGMA